MHYWRVERGLITALSVGGSILSQPSVGKLNKPTSLFSLIFVLISSLSPRPGLLSCKQGVKDTSCRLFGRPIQTF